LGQGDEKLPLLTGEGKGEGNLISLNICFNIPLILAFSRREKGKDYSAAS
jgi:hypothetical protein